MECQGLNVAYELLAVTLETATRCRCELKPSCSALGKGVKATFQCLASNKQALLGAKSGESSWEAQPGYPHLPSPTSTPNLPSVEAGLSTVTQWKPVESMRMDTSHNALNWALYGSQATLKSISPICP